MHQCGSWIFEFFHIFRGLDTYDCFLIICCILTIKLRLCLITSVYFQTRYFIFLYLYIFSTIKWRITPTAVCHLVLLHPSLIFLTYWNILKQSLKVTAIWFLFFAKYVIENVSVKCSRIGTYLPALA